MATRSHIREAKNEDTVIGTTRSGKPVYNSFENPSHKDFTSEDHKDAEEINDDAAEEMYDKLGKNTKEEKKLWDNGSKHAIVARGEKVEDYFKPGQKFSW